jgi:putative endonuclease
MHPFARPLLERSGLSGPLSRKSGSQWTLCRLKLDSNSHFLGRGDDQSVLASPKVIQYGVHFEPPEGNKNRRNAGGDLSARGPSAHGLSSVGIHALERETSCGLHLSQRGFLLPGWVYIMTNRPNGTLYVGVTDHLAWCAWEHRAGLVERFTKQYGLTRLVFAEHHDDMRAARQRERNMKHWRRAGKVWLILDQNPDWGHHTKVP